MTHVIALTGYAGVGKSTWADYLRLHYRYTELAFADRLKELLLDIDPIVAGNVRLSKLVEDHGWDIAKRTYPEIRHLLQRTGMGARKTLGQRVWIDPVIAEAKRHSHVVISDVRLPNEFEAILTAGFESVVTLRLERSGIGPVNGHVSENTALPHDIVVDLDSVTGHGKPYAIDALMELISDFRRGIHKKLPQRWSIKQALAYWEWEEPTSWADIFLDEVDKVTA